MLADLYEEDLEEDLEEYFEDHLLYVEPLALLKWCPWHWIRFSNLGLSDNLEYAYIAAKIYSGDRDPITKWGKENVPKKEPGFFKRLKWFFWRK